VRALYLGSSTYRIHGTDAPWTIGQNVSKGCIRMFNEDVMDLYPKVPTGTKVVVTWERFKTSATGEAIAEAPRAAPVEEAKPKAKSRSVASAPKAGFVVYGDDEAGSPAATASVDAEAEPGLQQDDGPVTVYTRNSDGTYSSEETDATPAKAGEQEVSRLGRKAGGKVSHASQTTVE
jgi:hypothetical protein